MTTQLYLSCFFAGILGQLFHVGVRIVKLAKRSKMAKTSFNIGQYFVDDKWPELLNLLALAITVYLLPEIVKFKPNVIDYLKFSFIAFGYMGSSLLSAALSRAESKINNIINEKTEKNS